MEVLVSYLLLERIAQKPIPVRVAGVITLTLTVIEITGLQVQVLFKIIIGKIKINCKKAFFKYSFLLFIFFQNLYEI